MSQGEPAINKLFRLACKRGASDLYLRVGSAPILTLQGLTRPTEMRPVTADDLEHLVLPILHQEQRRHLEQGETVVVLHGLEEAVAFRVAVSRQAGALRLSAHRLGAG